MLSHTFFAVITVSSYIWTVWSILQRCGVASVNRWPRSLCI